MPEHALQVLGDQQAGAGQGDAGEDERDQDAGQRAAAQQAQVKQRRRQAQLAADEQQPDGESGRQGGRGPAATPPTASCLTP